MSRSRYGGDNRSGAGPGDIKLSQLASGSCWMRSAGAPLAMSAALVISTIVGPHRDIYGEPAGVKPADQFVGPVLWVDRVAQHAQRVTVVESHAVRV